MPRSMRRLMVVILTGTSVLVVAALGLVITGQAAAVVTNGVSMNPVYYKGDLVVIAKRSSYEIGEIVAYHRPGHSGVVLHRIVGGNSNGYVFQGDNNGSIDPTQPLLSQMAGIAVMHIPQGGLWLDRVTSPAALGVIGFLLLATGGTAASTRRRRRRRTVSQHAARSPQPSRRSLTGLPRWATTPAAAAGVVGVLGVTPRRLRLDHVDRASRCGRRDVHQRLEPIDDLLLHRRSAGVSSVRRHHGHCAPAGLPQPHRRDRGGVLLPR